MYEDVRNDINAKLAGTSVAADRLQLLESLAKLSEIEKTNAEADKLRQENQKITTDISNSLRLAREDRWRFTLTVLAPLLTSLVLAVTVIVQIFQINQTSKFQKETLDTTNLREGLKMASSEDPQQSFPGATYLASMLNSNQYGPVVRDISYMFLSHIADASSFRALFTAVARDAGVSELPRVVELSRAIDSGYSRLSKVIARHDDKLLARMLKGAPADMILSELDEEASLVSDKLVQLLRRTPSETTIDLSLANISGSDLTSIKAGNWNIYSAILNGALVDDAELDSIDVFSESSWQQVTWWRAKRISKPLLTYLEKYFAYDNEVEYSSATSKPLPSQDEYDSNIARLTSS